MDRLRGFRVVLEVARSGSFHAAAANLAMSRTAVTKQVAQLEDVLGVRLLNRTTRQVGLTPSGQAAIEPFRRMLEQYDELQAKLVESASSPSGLIRVGTPPAFGALHLVPLVRRFTAQNSDIQVVLVLDVGDASLIQKGFDLSVRISVDMADSSLVARSIGSAPQVLVASPSYLAARGTPVRPEDLSGHNCLLHTIKSPTGIWRLQGPSGRHSIRVSGSLAADFGEPLRAAALDGGGIGMHPYYMVQDDIDTGRLVAVLPEYLPESHDIHVIWSNRHSLPERARRFVDFLRDEFRAPPPWARAR